jgi:copper homeostasis protein
MPERVQLEICVASVDDAVAAMGAGADRLELNCALSLGGLTPSSGLFAQVRRSVSVPLIAMVRPRAGGFCYSDTDFEVMLRDAEALLAAGADGLAFGVLTSGGEIDVNRCRKFRAVCGSRPPVFHRAFDVTPDPLTALDTLIDLKFTRVMTSGQAGSACAGSALIAEIVRRAAGRIEVLPAGRIDATTVTGLIARTGCNQVHASARTTGHDPSVGARPLVRFGSDGAAKEDRFDRTDPGAVAALRSAVGR